ncbi:MAG: tetratricopeptide repeat protein [Nitrospirae bacterium]|nr:tetratricopeptide repeat protein [Nitrospirota bacterium]
MARIGALVLVVLLVAGHVYAEDTMVSEEGMQELYNRAEEYQSNGEYEKAETLYKRVLEMIKKAYKTEEHEDVANVMNNLAGLYYATHRYTEAEPLYKRALEIWKKVYNTEEHENVVKVWKTWQRFIELQVVM